MRLRVMTALAAPVIAAGLLLGCSQKFDRAASGACGRDCLDGFIDRYLTALAMHDTAHLPLADNVKFVENDQLLQIGEGTWRTVTGLGSYRHYFPDPETGNVAAITVVEENGTKIIYDLRLKIEKHKIAEIEALPIRDPNGAATYEKLGKPLPIFMENVPEGERASRQELIGVADKYLSGMENNDPNGDYSFFADDCNRIEHGRQTTNSAPEKIGHTDNTEFVTMGCAAQFKQGGLAFVTRIRDRRFVVDLERQTVFAFADLDHNGTVRKIKLSTGSSYDMPPYFDVPRTLQVGEAYRIDRNKKLKEIEMTLAELPYGMRPPFDSGDDWLARGAEKNPPPAVANDLACDRDCLNEMVDKFLDAIVTHDPREVPMAPGFRYTENGQTLNPGDGLWGTTTKIGDYRVYLSNPANGETAFYGEITETSTPAILALRLKVDRNMVHEIEAFVVAEEHGGERGGTLTLFGPHLPYVVDPANFAKPDPALLRFIPPASRGLSRVLSDAALLYYEGVEQRDGSIVPFGEKCVERVNGVTVTNAADAAAPDPAFPTFRPDSLGCADRLSSRYFSNIKLIRNKRSWVADDERGLVLDIALLDIPDVQRTVMVPNVGTVTRPMLTTGPYSMMQASLFKVEDGKIERVESAIRPVPYGMTSGWE
jgi:hypothetical protein